MLKSEQHTDDGLVKCFSCDKEFNRLCSPRNQLLSQIHWTPVEIALGAAKFLADRTGAKILDIGSGVGKFCLVAGYHFPQMYWYGIEQRSNLVHQAASIKRKYQLRNVFFDCGDFTRIDFNRFDHFYFFNSFFENLDEADRIDDDRAYSEQLFRYYSQFLYEQLASRPIGTRLAALDSTVQLIPRSYIEIASAFNGQLKFWEKNG